MINEWVLSKLELVKNHPFVLVRDSLRLLPEVNSMIHTFAQDNKYTVIQASTNLAFRDLYERAVADPDTKRILVIDKAPIRRRNNPSVMKAPPPFYPDLLVKIPVEARIEVDLRQFLIEKTGDSNWPKEANDPYYARLITQFLPQVIRAHKNLLTAHSGRFTDHDFKTIVAFAAMGISESAFKKLGAEDYWKIGLIGHQSFSNLDSIAPEVTKPIKEQLHKAPAPFCWLASHDPEKVIRAFYLSVILAQHLDNWNLLLANIDPLLAPMAGLKGELLEDAASRLIAINPKQAESDLEIIEKSLSVEALKFILIDQMKITERKGFKSALEKEGYSSLVRSLALLVALNDILSNNPAREEQKTIYNLLFTESKGNLNFVESRDSLVWSNLKEAYQLANEIFIIRENLTKALKNLKVVQPKDLTYAQFREIWNQNRVNRLEYYISSLERKIYSSELLHRAKEELPEQFNEVLDKIRERIAAINDSFISQINDLNRVFQEFVKIKYPFWVNKEGEVYLTSQFIHRCLKPNWDQQKEKSVLFVFDGMRYDIWDEFLKPMLQDKLEILKDLPALSILPSETHITRKAIFAGSYPDEFDTRSGEDKLLKEALKREYGINGNVDVVAPEALGTGETVRYRTDNLDVYIFELCDKELHKVPVKTLPNGNQVPSRPLAFIYQQHIKNIIDTEVMAIIRNLSPGTKVFITADHGFCRVGRESLSFNESDLNEKLDCVYLNCYLKMPIEIAKISSKVRNNIISFTPKQLRLPEKEVRIDQKTGNKFEKKYEAIVFPRVGYSFSRQGSPYNPDAYTHGGISIEELMIPMIVLRVKKQEEGIIVLNDIQGPIEIIEGDVVEFKMGIYRNVLIGDEIRVDVEAIYGLQSDQIPLASQVLYVPTQGTEVKYQFSPDCSSATSDERHKGFMERFLTIAVIYREGMRNIRKSQTFKFTIRLNSEQIIRRVPVGLGNILGLTPKSMR